MDEILKQIDNVNDDEEDEDYENFFLKPASSPYNIAEKVHQANLDLFDDAEESGGQVNQRRETKVTFREQVVTFEPELTDDDVVSIESDKTETISNESFVTPETLEYKSQPCWTKIVNENVTEKLTDIYSIAEEDPGEISEDIEEDSLDEEEYQEGGEELNVIDRVLSEQQEESDQGSNDSIEIEEESANIEDSKVIQTKIIDLRQNFDDPDSASLTTSAKTPKRKKFKKSSKQTSPLRPDCIECKSHCIEKLESNLSMSIRRLELQEKPVLLPPLKLYERKCCRSNKHENENLPCYDGFRSEYGLSLAQLERRERTKQLTRMQRQQRRELLEEYRERRTRQNEEVFREWLKEISKRKEERQKINRSRGNVRSGSSQRQHRVRPRTSCVVPRNSKRNKPTRPKTSHFCVEVPEAMLASGIDLNSLLNLPLTSKKIHLFSVS